MLLFRVGTRPLARSLVLESAVFDGSPELLTDQSTEEALSLLDGEAAVHNEIFISRHFLRKLIDFRAQIVSILCCRGTTIRLHALLLSSSKFANSIIKDKSSWQFPLGLALDGKMLVTDVAGSNRVLIPPVARGTLLH